jgi:hypothetical protein
MTDLSTPSQGLLRAQRMKLLAWPIVLIPFFALIVQGWANGPGLDGGDHAHYLLHARALAEGRPYTDTGYIYTKYAWAIGPRAQPPGLPIALAPVLAISGENMLVVRLFMLSFAFAFLLVVGRYFARHEDRFLGMGVALMMGVCTPIVYASGQPLSDLPFAALLWGLVSVYDRDGPWGKGRLVAATALAGATMAFRTAGIAIIPAICLFTLLQYRQHRLRPAVPLLVLLTCAALIVLAASASGYLLDFELSLPAVLIATDPLEKLLGYQQEVAAGLLYPVPGNLANDIYHGIALVIVAVGIAEWIWRKWRSFSVILSVLYCVMIISVQVHSSRYLWPLFPVLVFGLLNGGRVLLEKARPGWKKAQRRGAVLAAAGVIVFSSIFFGPSVAPKGSLERLPAVQELFDHLREAASTEELRVAFVKPRVLSWETGIPAIATFNADRNTILDVLRREHITSVVLGDYGLAHRHDQAFRVAVAQTPDAFHLEFENEYFSAYRFAEPPTDNP